MKLTVNVSDPPLASLILIKHIKSSKIDIEWRQETKLVFDDISFTSDVSICRYLARLFPGYNLYGSSTFQYTEVDHWLSFTIGRLDNDSKIVQNLKYLDTELQTVTYLVSEAITIADIVLWSALFNRQFWTLVRKQDYVNLFRWYSFIESHDSIKDCLNSLPSEIKQKMQARSSSGTNSERKEEGKFIELPGAEIGKVVVRFPPEASGYLHIGHAKAALLNQYYQEKFEGKLIMRFDDTNPAKEKVDFEKVILEDLELLQIKPDKFTHSSDYFDLMLQYCEKLLKEGKAYVDDTDPEIMKQEREQRLESKNRANSIEKNFQMWDEMQKGTEYGQKCCVRAKIDMKSDNGCLRDPTIYRCKNETHPKTGDKYKVYPTYDFACPIVDSIEGVTHCLRTTEYHDRDDQFYWFIEALNLRKPYIWEYSRLNMTNTVLSKRKLTWFVEEGYVDGWDDPRFPTVRGILRHGMTVTGLKQFIIAQGSSRSVVSMEWDKIWAFNKKVIDPVAPRYTALESQRTVPVIVKDVKTENVQVPKHPKNEEVGKKTIWKHNRILIDYIDAEALKENENATFINWGNFMIKKINKDKQKIVSIEAEENLSNTDYKKTLKLTWLAELREVPFVPCVCVYWDHIISKPVLGKDEDFKTYINSNTKIERIMLGDPELQDLKKGDIIQLQRRGFYICDEEYKPPSVHTGCATPVILFFIPDGHSKESPITALSKKEAMKEESKSQSKSTVGEKKQKDAKTSLPKPSNSSDISNSNILEAKRILDAIKNQGDRVRQLKADKSEKSVIDDEVKALIQLKAQFKTITNLDWKPGVTLDHLDKSAPASASVSTSSKSDSELFNKVCLQTSKIRYMQTKKFDKNQINTEVTILTDLKERYKSVTGREWVQPPNVDINQYYNEFLENLYDKVTIQGNKIRKLKAEKADNDVIALEVKNLLSLKAEYKETSGSDYKPPDSKMVDNKESASNHANDLHNKIIEQGNKVRKLKSAGSTKEVVQEEVKILLELKDQFKQVTGISWTPDVKLESFSTKPAQNVEKSNVNEKKKSKPKQEPKKQAPEPSASGQKKQTRLGLEAKKTEDLSDWYTQVITKGELIEYYDVSGCYILRPGSIAIWDTIREWFKRQITNMGIKECYFPIFVSKNALEKEKTHIEDFAPEVAWVTKSGETDLEEPVAIRPTSETIMYPAYAKWIRSHRDLPLRLNQWNNVVRWEFKHPQPFLRTREFLWQEGHTAFSSKKEAEEEVHAILDLYSKVYTDLLAVPVIKGRKTKKEQFAGSDFSTTIEAFISASGRGIQAATSHHLGQNFSKMFEIEYEDPETQEKKFVYQNSWGLTTRTIGVMIMIHGDDQGLVIPPRVAEIQVIIVPCGISSSLKQEDRDLLDKSCIDLENCLKLAGIKVHFDSRDNYSPGWKFNHWELKGVPVRIELGPKDIKQNQLVAVRRDNGEKLILKRDVADTSIKNLLETIQQSMYKKAEEDLKSHTIICEDWASFVKKLNEKNIILAPFCGAVECEEKIKEDSAKGESTEPGALTSGAKSLCMPFEQPKSISASTKCINPNCSIPPVNYTLFGRSY